MIAEFFKSIRRWYDIKVLKADIAGYEDDQYTLELLGMTASPAYQQIEELRQEARTRLYLLQRGNPA